jgi:DNA polymerase V
MQAVNRINRRFPGGITIAAAGFDKAWQSRAERISRRYATNWREFVSVIAG